MLIATHVYALRHSACHLLRRGAAAGPPPWCCALKWLWMPVGRVRSIHFVCKAPIAGLGLRVVFATRCCAYRAYPGYSGPAVAGAALKPVQRSCLGFERVLAVSQEGSRRLSSQADRYRSTSVSQLVSENL